MKIKMNLSQSIEDVYARFMLFKKASGLADKTISTYSQQFRCISNYLDPHIPIDELTSDDLNQMINKMRDKGLSANSIRSYTRMLKVFLTWCNEENITTLNIKKYKGEETIKETYSDDELKKLFTTAYKCSTIYGISQEKSTLMIFDRHANLKYKYGKRRFCSRPDKFQRMHRLVHGNQE